MVASVLLGAGYNALVAASYAPKHIVRNDLNVITAPDEGEMRELRLQAIDFSRKRWSSLYKVSMYESDPEYICTDWHISIYRCFALIFMHVALLVQHESDTGTSASRMQGTPTEQPQSGGNVCNSQGDNDRDPSLDSLLMHAYILLLPPQREVILITDACMSEMREFCQQSGGVIL